MLKVEQVAKRLNCSASTVYSLIESGRLGHHRCPGVRISEEQLTAYMMQSRRGQRPKVKKTSQPRPPLRHIRLK